MCQFALCFGVLDYGFWYRLGGHLDVRLLGNHLVDALEGTGKL